MTFSCIVCGRREGLPWRRECPDYFLRRGAPVDYYRCGACGLVQQHPLPQGIATFYEAYPVHARKSRVYEAVRRRLLAPVYFDAAALPAGANLLDYGCGDGGYLQSLRGRGLHLLGYEPGADHAAHLARELSIPVYSDEEQLLAEQQGRLQAVTMHYVLEHLAEPHRCFERVRQLLVPGGLFYVVVPNIHSWESRVFGALWHGLDAPRHIWFPDAAVLRRLADEHGFEVMSQCAVPFPNTSAASLVVWLAGRYRPALFLALLPVGLLASRVRPSGTQAYLLKKSDETFSAVKSPRGRKDEDSA